MSLAAGIMIILIVIIRALFLNELPKLTFPILWLAVLIRLILPISFEAPFSPNDFLLQPIVTNFAPEEIGLFTDHNNLNPSYASSSEQLTNLYTNQTQIEGGATINTRITDAITINWLWLGWATGFTASSIFFIFNYWKSHQKIKCAIPVEHDHLTRWKTEQQLKRPLQILISDQLTTPVTTGIIKPKIVLPKQLELSNELNLEYVLTHELYHIKRWDSLWKIIIFTVACIHWFNPLVWVMCILFNRDLEISCDAWVVKKMGNANKKIYAYSLVEIAEQRQGFTPFYSGFARNAVKERIVSIMKAKKTTAFGMTMAILIVSVLTMNAFANSTVANFRGNDDVIKLSLRNNNWNIEDVVFTEIQLENLSFKVGDLALGERRSDLPKPDLADDALSAEAVSILVARQIYYDLGVDLNGTIFDIYLNPSAERDRSIWTGWILAAEFLEFPTAEQVLFRFSIFTDTGEMIYNAFTEVHHNNMTFSVGDLFGASSSSPDFFLQDLPANYLSKTEVSIILADAINERLGFSVDNTIFNINARPLGERSIWSGWIVKPEHMISQGEEGMEHMLFYVSIFADTGEIRIVNHRDDNGWWTIYDDWMTQE